MVQIVILEYTTDSVYFYQISKEIEVEDWIVNNTDHNIDDIQYMVADYLHIHKCFGGC